MFNANKDPKLYNLEVIFLLLKLKTLEKVENLSIWRKIQKCWHQNWFQRWSSIHCVNNIFIKVKCILCHLCIFKLFIYLNFKRHFQIYILHKITFWHLEILPSFTRNYSSVNYVLFLGRGIFFPSLYHQ